MCLKSSSGDCFFWWQKCLPDARHRSTFSGASYATIGYGDVVLPKGWWLFGPAEGLTGILMCGLSTALFFAVLSKQFFRASKVRNQIRSREILNLLAALFLFFQSLSVNVNVTPRENTI